MPTATEQLPLTETVTPASAEELAAAVETAYHGATPVYPIGGGTSLDFGLPARDPGIAISLSGLTSVVDYPARDMTITVEAGITMTALAEKLAAERQRLPIDAPRAELATLGGVLATASSGPRRYGQGTIRDYVIGVSAVDGRGMPFKGGGRVVKNVAGYDFCKLLTGSMGTLAVVTQVTLKVKPIPDASAIVFCSMPDLAQAELLLAGLVNSRTTPSAIEFLTGAAWNEDLAAAGVASGAACLVVGLEGTEAEVAWMIGQLAEEWRAAGAVGLMVNDRAAVQRWWDRLAEFPAEAAADGQSLPVLKANLPPSAVVSYVQLLGDADPACSIQSHAGTGIVVARMSGAAVESLSHLLLSRLQPAAVAAGGNVSVLSCPAGGYLTRQSYWGAAHDDRELMRAVKQQFDPADILNRGRFWF